MQSKRRAGAISLVTGSQSWQQGNKFRGRLKRSYRNIFLMKLIKRSGFFTLNGHIRARAHLSVCLKKSLIKKKKRNRLQNLEELPRVMGVI